MQHSRHQVLNTACLLAVCSSRSVAVGAVGATSFFTGSLSLRSSGTAGPLLPELPPSSTCSLVHRNHLQELFTFSVRQLVVRLELGSQVPSTTFLHERDASVRSFPDEVRISTVSGKTVSQPQQLRSCVDRSALPMFMTLNRTNKFTTSPRTFAPSNPKILAPSSRSPPPPAANCMSSTHAEPRLVQWIRVCADVHRKSTHFNT